MSDNGRALPRQIDDSPWQSLRRFPISWGAGAQCVATHHGEHSVWWSWDFSSGGKVKGLYLQEERYASSDHVFYLKTGPN